MRDYGFRFRVQGRIKENELENQRDNDMKTGVCGEIWLQYPCMPPFPTSNPSYCRTNPFKASCLRRWMLQGLMTSVFQTLHVPQPFVV